VTSVTYSKDNLRTLGRAIAGKEGVEDFELTRSDWLAAQARDWTQIWRLPALFIAVWFVVFLLLGRNPKEDNT
jgi:hypothetical protein